MLHMLGQTNWKRNSCEQKEKGEPDGEVQALLDVSPLVDRYMSTACFSDC